MITAFYTKSYEPFAMRLLASCDDLNLPCDIQLIEDQGSWTANVRHKPLFIEAQLTKYNQPILFLDADCLVKQRPELLLGPLECDVAAYFNAHDNPWSTVLYFNNTPGAREVLKRWKTALSVHPNDPNDTIPLRVAFKKSPTIKILHLPPQYCWTPSVMKDRFSGITPFIEHGMISKG